MRININATAVIDTNYDKNDSSSKYLELLIAFEIVSYWQHLGTLTGNKKINKHILMG